MFMASKDLNGIEVIAISSTIVLEAKRKCSLFVIKVVNKSLKDFFNMGLFFPLQVYLGFFLKPKR